MRGVTDGPDSLTTLFDKWPTEHAAGHEPAHHAEVDDLDEIDAAEHPLVSPPRRDGRAPAWPPPRRVLAAIAVAVIAVIAAMIAGTGKPHPTPSTPSAGRVFAPPPRQPAARRAVSPVAQRHRHSPAPRRTPRQPRPRAPRRQQVATAPLPRRVVAAPRTPSPSRTWTGEFTP